MPDTHPPNNKQSRQPVDTENSLSDRPVNNGRDHHDVPGGRLQASIFHGILKFPVIILLLFLVLAGALGYQARYFEIDASPDTLLTQGNELYIQSQRVSQRYAPEEFLLLTYQPRSHALFSQQTFDDLSAISDAVLQMERVQSVRSMLNVPIFAGMDGVQGLDADLDQMTIENGDYDMSVLEQEFTDHPIYTDLLVNQAATAAGIQIVFAAHDELAEIQAEIATLNIRRLEQGELAPEDEQRLQSLQSQREPLDKAIAEVRLDEVDQIRAIVAPYAERAEVHLGGVHVLGYQLIQIISEDLRVFGLAIAVMICVLLFALFRSLRWILVPVLCCVLSVLPTMGLFALLNIKATVISSNFIALQLILTLAIVMHLIVDYREVAVARSGLSPREKLHLTMMRKAGPCFFAGLTTSVGFASLLASGIQPVISFGWMMIIAMFFSILASLVLFPALVALLPRGQGYADYPALRAIVDGLRYLATRRSGVVLVGSAAILVLGIAGALRLDAENSFINYFKETTQVHQELAYIDQEFGGSTPMDMIYSLQDQSTDPDIVLSADAVLMMQRIQNALSRHEAVGRVLSPVNLTDLARQVNNDRPLTEYELTAIYWMMDEAFRDELVGSFFDEEQQEVRFNVWVKDLTPELQRDELLQNIRGDMAELGSESSDYQLTNLFVMYQDIMAQLVDSQLTTLLIVYVALTLTFVLVFRSLPIALIAVAPNILSTAAVFGIMGWAGIPLDLMSITIAAIVMGIGVDDTIHYTYRYLAERQRHSADEAIRRSHGSVGMAALYTSLLISGGFLMLVFSDFVPSIIFGALTAAALLVALLSDLCLLPWLLGRYVKPKDGPQQMEQKSSEVSGEWAKGAS